ncbi:hypothetical protein LMG28688_06599 [Paraburkholderia caffeinitolerans]|uniref:Uncharacterized protein n=1 Tax=Paraburkholderia caffeinitolerans TaxID=1723730 RepID=A0A6J5GYI0_9BURK|nr:hypothetical protein [Paraburkholderia caffeinitolerans]CAB3807666.1 hypothetical protein LMG28688_06599 [Paraburkholderia caffeinitolerans]
MRVPVAPLAGDPNAIVPDESELAQQLWYAEQSPVSEQIGA